MVAKWNVGCDQAIQEAQKGRARLSYEHDGIHWDPCKLSAGIDAGRLDN
jgi:hypothetical protein